MVGELPKTSFFFQVTAILEHNDNDIVVMLLLPTRPELMRERIFFPHIRESVLIFDTQAISRRVQYMAHDNTTHGTQHVQSIVTAKTTDER